MSLIGPSIHACGTFKHHLLALEGNKDVFDSILKALLMQSPVHISKDIICEDSDYTLIVYREAVNLFCK